MQLQAIAQKLNCDLSGDPTLEITGVAALAEAQPGQLSFVSDARYLPLLEQTQASALIIDAQTPKPKNLTVLRSANPRLSFAQAIELFYAPYRQPTGIHPTAEIAPDAEIGQDVAIGPYVVIGSGVTIGARSQIHAHVVIYAQAQIGCDCQLFAHCVIHERTQIGDRCLIHSGAVIGDDGFGHVLQANGRWYRMPQSGRVVLHDEVDVGSNTTIDRPAVGQTCIGRGTKIDNLVQIGHGVQIGSDCVLASQSGIAGGTEVGNNVILAGQVGLAGHLKIGDRVVVAAGTGVTGNIAAGERVAGFPHQPASEWRRTVAIQRHLPEWAKTIRRLERRLAALEDRRAGDQR